MNLQKLLSKGHLVPIYRPVGEDLCLVGYRRKPRSRKSHQRPIMLQQPIVLGPLTPNPETKQLSEHSVDTTEMIQARPNPATTSSLNL